MKHETERTKLPGKSDRVGESLSQIMSKEAKWTWLENHGQIDGVGQGESPEQQDEKNKGSVGLISKLFGEKRCKNSKNEIKGKIWKKKYFTLGDFIKNKPSIWKDQNMLRSNKENTETQMSPQKQNGKVQIGNTSLKKN